MKIFNLSCGRLAAGLALLLSALTAQAVPPGSAYRTDVQTTFANDASYDNFKQVVDDNYLGRLTTTMLAG